MPIIYSTAVKNARLEATISEIGAGGVIVIGTSALSGATGVLATVPLEDPSFVVSAGKMTLNDLPRVAVASATGTAAKAELRDASGTVIITGLTVGATGTDITINATAVSVGQTVQITAGTINHG